jgi:Secretion system C-terminal sorting domain
MKHLYFLLLSFLTLSIHSQAQINAYASVTAVSGTTLTLSSVNQTYGSFSNGEQIIIMQMQDNVVGANTTNVATYGNLTGINKAGAYEIATISSVAGLPSSITITGALGNTYNFGANSAVQVISFPSFGSPNYTTTSAITALPWNGQIGGVVAMQVPGTLTLAYSITADGAGFRGGSVSSDYEVGCEPGIYASNSSNYATKGEGIQANATGLLYGRNALATGGGGGSDDNGGGGGGSNYTAGGQGGAGWTCAATPSGGFGGNSVSTYITKWRLFMGGGGGGGQQNNNVGSSGSNGGGIILLQAQTLVTSCTGSLTISASGANAANSGNDGSGGGGAGGSIYMSVNNFNVSTGCPLTVQGNGGNGGNVTNSGAHGGGGGGGQGVVVYPSTPPTTNITTNTASGTGGANDAPETTAASSAAGTTNSGVLANNGIFALAVGVNDFTGHIAGTEVLLNWNMESTEANTIFNIERSADGKNFTTIGTVDGDAFTDPAPNPGHNYYRLEQTALDGTASYTSIVEENFQQLTTAFTIFPNPVKDHFTIGLNSSANASYVLALFETSGKKVLARQGESNGGQIYVPLDRKLTPGIYFVQVTSQEQTFSGQVFVQ